jgi:hypothetical protein
VPTLIALTALALLGDPESVDARVVEYARSKLGQKVGDGECTALAAAALRHAGAGLPGRGGEPWGEERKSLADVRPGDILQFEGVRLVNRRVRDDGAIVTRNMNFPHHTAVVSSVKRRGKQPALVILHQNIAMDGDEARRKVVQEWTIDLADRKKGTIRAYQPLAAMPGD